MTLSHSQKVVAIEIKRWLLLRIMLVLICLLLIPSVFALEECQRVQERDGIPCRVTTTWSPPLACDSYEAIIFNDQGQEVNRHNLSIFGNSSFCQFTFVQNSLGSYPYNLTTGDTGNVNVVQQSEVKMLSIVGAFIFGIGLLVFIGILGRTLPMKFVPWGVALIQFIIMFFIIYAKETGGDITGILRTNFIGMLLIVGFFGLVNIWAFYVHMATPEIDDSDNRKWHSEDKWSGKN